MGPAARPGTVGEVPIRSPVGNSRVRGEAARHATVEPRAGYVLIEVVAALAITMLIMAFAFPFAPLSTTPSRLLALVSSSVSVLRDARTAAVAQGRIVGAHYDAVQRTLRSGGNAVTIPADVGFDLLVGGNCPAGERAAEVLFRPDGTNCGGSLRFSRSGRVIRVRVNWVDGHIDVLNGG